MLRFIIGKNETARRKMLYSHIVECESSLLIVPEQFSFESEKLLDELLGTKVAQKTEVLSFSHLAGNIFRKFGGVAGEYTDETVKLLLMGSAVFSAYDNLGYYKNNAKNASFIEKLVATDNELKNAGVSAEELLRLSEEAGTLGEKSKDLGTIFTLYNAMLEKSYVDPLTDLKRACEILSENDFFGDKAVFIDNFTGFTGSEYAMLKIIFAQSKRVEISLCCDDIFDKTAGLGLFSKTQNTAGRLLRLGKEAGQEIKSPIHAHLENDRRPKGIVAVEENFLQDNPENISTDSSIRIIKARDPYDEAEFVAASVRALAENEGLRYRDIVVIAREPSSYEHALSNAFKKFDIPIFMDSSVGLNAHPLSAFISATLSAIADNFQADDIMRLLKTGLFPTDEALIAEFENYCFTWSIRGALFTLPFTGSPSGFRELREEDFEVLERLNALREKIINPLLALKEKLNNPTGEEFSSAFYEFLTECEITDGLMNLYNELRAEGEISAAENLDSFWNFTVSALDKITVSLKNVRLGRDGISRLFELIIKNAQIGVLPHTLDCVFVGSAARMRPSEIKAVFVIGLCDGVFPAKPKGSSLFTENERKEMAKLGIELGEGENAEILAERMYAYTAFCCASQKVFASYSNFSFAFEEQNPSLLIEKLKEATGVKNEENTQDFPEDFWLGSEEYAFLRLAQKQNKSSSVAEAMRLYFSEQEKWKERVSLLGSYVKPEEFTLKNPKNIEKLYGEGYRFSPTRLDTYGKCAFSYFLKSGLMLKERKKAELSPISSGNIIHKVLEELCKKYGGKGLSALSDDELKSEINSVLDEYLEKNMDSEKGKTARFLYLYKRTGGFLFKLLRRLGTEFSRSEFVPFAFEEPLGGDNIGLYRLLGKDGKQITVDGFVDRIDVLRRDGKLFVRVVDYKTGSKDFDFSDIYYGLNMQMLVYLFSIWEEGKGELKNAIPSGVLYMPAKDSVLGAERNSTVDEIIADQLKLFTAKGLLLDDITVLNAMEPGLEGNFINIKPKKNGITGEVATLAEFGEIKNHIDNLLLEIADEISKGNIRAIPYKKGETFSCDLCPYKEVCRRGEASPFEIHDSFGRGAKEEFFSRLNGSDEHE